LVFVRLVFEDGRRILHGLGQGSFLLGEHTA
jgi:hypothetical protein